MRCIYVYCRQSKKANLIAISELGTLLMVPIVLWQCFPQLIEFQLHFQVTIKFMHVYPQEPNPVYLHISQLVKSVWFCIFFLITNSPLLFWLLYFYSIATIQMQKNQAVTSMAETTDMTIVHPRHWTTKDVSTNLFFFQSKIKPFHQIELVAWKESEILLKRIE